MVLGVRVHGPDVLDAEVKLDETFRSVPVPEKLGIPVLYKKQPGTGGSLAQGSLLGEGRGGSLRLITH